MSKVGDIKKEILASGSAEKAKTSSRFFKTGLGQYGEGDVFVGVTVPQQRTIAKRHLDMSVDEVLELLHSPEHEFRSVALMIWTYQFPKLDEGGREAIYHAYLANTRWINNWDLVDGSARDIVGAYLLDRDKEVLVRLAKSGSLWAKRIAIIATHAEIMAGRSQWTFQIADILIDDPHDLLQKAVGWMLREVGKRVSREELIDYLSTRYKTMPRTALRYSIEHFDQPTRQDYLAGRI